MKKLIFLAIFGLAFSAQAKGNPNVFWGCSLEDMELVMIKDQQLLPVFGIFYASEYVGYGQLTCQSATQKENFLAPVKMTLKMKSVGLGTEKPSKLNMITLGAGIKTNSPEGLFGEHSVGLKVGLTFIEGEAGLALKIQNPKKGLAMDFGIFAEETKGLKLSADAFSIKIEPVVE
jgi:hypothetical protein